MDFSTELQSSLREFAATGAVEVHENGGRVASLSGMFWEVRGSAEKPLLHLWSQQFNLTRRVLAITDHSSERLALAVQRFGRAKPDRLEFLRVDFERSARTLSREEFRDHLKRLLAEQFPDETLESLTVAADLEHSLSGNYARGILRRGSMEIAVLAVPDGESADTADNSLTFALLWLGRARNSSRRGALSTLRLILPKDTTRNVAHRFAAFDPKLQIELYERDSSQEKNRSARRRQPRYLAGAPSRFRSSARSGTAHTLAAGFARGHAPIILTGRATQLYQVLPEFPCKVAVL